MRRRHSSSRCTNCCSTLALRPPNSGGCAGSSQPLSNSSRCHFLAQVGICDTDRGRSNVSASLGRLSSRNAANSARNDSTSSSKVSCTILLGDEGAMLCGIAEHQFPRLRAFNGELQVVFPCEPHSAKALQSMLDDQRLCLPRCSFRHRGEKAATRIVSGDGERREV